MQDSRHELCIEGQQQQQAIYSPVPGPSCTLAGVSQERRSTSAARAPLMMSAHIRKDGSKLSDEVVIHHVRQLRHHLLLLPLQVGPYLVLLLGLESQHRRCSGRRGALVRSLARGGGAMRRAAVSPLPPPASQAEKESPFPLFRRPMEQEQGQL